MSQRSRLFAVIVAAAFAVNFTMGAIGLVVWLLQTADGSLRLEDPNAVWVHLAINAVLAVILWAVAVRLWSRFEPQLTGG
jgi:hypothetical protein